MNLIAIILGWDGLGVTSYLLVIYYQRWKSYSAGILTALRNRVGDVLIILGVCYSINQFRALFTLDRLYKGSLWRLIVFVLRLASFTKRAQIPFSAWLPAAIAAPTPVSALVHSSTLVTAGVYLMVRFYDCVFQHSNLILFIGRMTMIMAGLAALKESDIKKVVALSTLSQLGLIFRAIGINQWLMAYFHLITHAFMKALLFIAIGNSIHYVNDYQDLKKSRIFLSKFPYSSRMVFSANVALIGFPFLSGFYSKDLWVENRVRTMTNLFIVYIFYLGVVLTVIYRTRLLYLLFLKEDITFPLNMVSDKGFFKNFPISLLWVFILSSGSFLGWGLFLTPKFIYIRLGVKNLTLDLILLFLVFSFIMNFSSRVRLLHGASIFKTLNNWVIKNMFGLPLISTGLLIEISFNLAKQTRVFLDMFFFESLIVRFKELRLGSFLFKHKGLLLLNFRLILLSGLILVV